MKRIKHILLKLGKILIIIVAVLLLLNTAYVLYTGAKLRGQIQALREQGKAVTYQEHCLQRDQDALNAADDLNAIYDETKAIEKEINQAIPPTKAIQDYTQDDLEIYAKIVAQHPGVLPGLAKAATQTYFNSVTTQTSPELSSMDRLLTTTQRHRAYFYVLKLETKRCLSQGDTNGAMKTVLQSFQLARLLDEEPAFLGYLIQIACQGVAIQGAVDVLRHGPVDAELHAQLAAECERILARPRWQYALDTERIIGMETLEGFNCVGWLSRGYINSQQSGYLEMMDVLQNRFSQATFADYKAGFPEYKVGIEDVLLGLVLPAFDKIFLAHTRTVCQVRCLQIMNETIAQQMTPEQLIERLKSTVDPYTEKPLKYQFRGEVLSIYGLGENQTDDGGDPNQFKDVVLKLEPTPKK